MSLFRFTPAVYWTGRVHEQLVGLSGRHVVLPWHIYGHYGQVFPVRRYAEKGRLYSSLGAPGDIVPEDQLDAIDARTRFFTGILAARYALHGRAPNGRTAHDY